MNADLFIQAQNGDKDALEALWMHTKAYACSVAHRFYPTASVSTEDLLQCAYLGFHVAVMQHTGRYDFLSLVRWCTQRECQKALGIYGSRRQIQTVSLDVTMPDGEHTIEDMVEDESLPEISTGIETDDLVRDVRSAVSDLPERERSVIERHWFNGITLRDIGDEDGVSAERARGIEERAFSRLRSDPVLRTYATRPSSSFTHKGLKRFMQTGESSVEHEALLRICAAKKKAAYHPADRYAALLDSLVKDGFLPASPELR